MPKEQLDSPNSEANLEVRRILGFEQIRRNSAHKTVDIFHFDFFGYSSLLSN